MWLWFWPSSKQQPRASASSCQQAPENQRKRVALPPTLPACLLSLQARKGDGLSCRDIQHGGNHERFLSIPAWLILHMWTFYESWWFIVICREQFQQLTIYWSLCLGLMCPPPICPSLSSPSQPPVYHLLHCPLTVMVSSTGATVRRKILRGFKPPVCQCHHGKEESLCVCVEKTKWQENVDGAE